jgi:hypothetical protein
VRTPLERSHRGGRATVRPLPEQPGEGRQALSRDDGSDGRWITVVIPFVACASRPRPFIRFGIGELAEQWHHVVDRVLQHQLPIDGGQRRSEALRPGGGEREERLPNPLGDTVELPSHEVDGHELTATLREVEIRLLDFDFQLPEPQLRRLQFRIGASAGVSERALVGARRVRSYSAFRGASNSIHRRFRRKGKV